MDPVLDDADIRVVLEATTLLASDPPQDIEGVLDLLRSLIACTSASFNDMTLAAGDYRYVIVPPDHEELATRLKPVYDRLAGSQHPLIGAARLQPEIGAVRFCDVPGGDTFTDTEFYNEFFVPFGLRYQMAIQLPAPPDVIVGYALNRSADHGEFSNRDAAVLNALGPHLAMHHRHMVDLERSRAMTVETDRRGGWTVMTVRADGTVDRSSSSSARAELAPDGRLPDDVVTLLPSYDDMPSKPTTTDITVDENRWRCVIHPVPIGPTVLLVRPLEDEAPEATALIDMGLTPRQTDVAVALARTGGTNAQLARSLGISDGTVKKHLEAVFQLLGVDSRAGAIVALRSADGPGQSDE
jgi:DNA-binding CsgD family transcriptional regulator